MELRRVSVLLGLGWSFLFVGGTTLLTNSYSGAEKAVAQGLNDFSVFGTVPVTALGSGALHHAFGGMPSIWQWRRLLRWPSGRAFGCTGG